MWRFNNGKKHTVRSRKRERLMWKSIIVAALILLMLTVAGLMFLGYGDHWTAVQAQIDILPDGNAKKGTLYDREMLEVEDGDFWVLVNQLPTAREGNNECNIEFENPSANHYSARITLYLNETGELLGNTRRVDPGNYVESIHLKQELSVGEYPVNARIELFQEKIPAGELSLDLSLRVVEKNGEGQDEY